MNNILRKRKNKWAYVKYILTCTQIQQRLPICKHITLVDHTYLVQLMGISGPDTSTQTVLGVVGDSNGLLGGLEGRTAHHGAEDLLLL